MPQSDPTPGSEKLAAPADAADKGAPAAEEFVRPPTPPTKEALARRRKVATIAAVAIGVGVAVLTFVLLNRGDPEPVVLEPLPAETVTAPVPTPALEPVERDTSTAFLAALPATVLQWSVSAQAPAQDLLAAGALEAATLTYTDGEQDATLTTAQWRSPEAAAAAIAAAGIAGEPVRTEEVLVAGAPAGTMALYEEEAGDRVVWTNGATSFALQTPAGEAANFYDAFGM